MAKITDDLKKKEHDQELSKARTKLTMAEQAKKTMAEDLKQSKVKEQELSDQVKKLISEKEELRRTQMLANEKLAAETR